MRRTLRRLLKQKRGMVGIEAAIVLIAFVIVAAAFSFMVVNMGLFSTQRGRDIIQQGISEASNPLIIDGSIMVRGNASGDGVDAMMIPLKTIGTRYVAMDQNVTEISLRIGNQTAYANIYYGINTAKSPLNTTLDALVTAVNSSANGDTRCQLFIGNSNGDSSLDFGEKGLLILYFGADSQAAARMHVLVEVRPGNGAPVSVEVVVPSELTQGWLSIGA
jgi:flagellin FlaB